MINAERIGTVYPNGILNSKGAEGFIFRSLITERDTPKYTNNILAEAMTANCLNPPMEAVVKPSPA